VRLPPRDVFACDALHASDEVVHLKSIIAQVDSYLRRP